MEWHEMQDAKYHQMTETPIPGLIARLAVPTICSMLITSIYNMADTYFVSQLGTDASAAVGVIFSLMALIQAVGFTFGIGSSTCAGAEKAAGGLRIAFHRLLHLDCVRNPDAHFRPALS